MASYGQSEGSLIKGTVELTNADATVTGTGTSFNTELSTGTELMIGDRIYTVATIASATSLELNRIYYSENDEASGFALEDGTLDAPDSATSITETAVAGSSSLLLDGTLDSAGNITNENERWLAEAGTDSLAGLQVIKRDMPKFLTEKQKARCLGINQLEQAQSNDSVLSIKFNANANSNGSGGSGYTGNPTVTIAAPATFTFDPTSDSDGDGELTIEDAGFGGKMTFTDHGFATGTAVVYNDGGGTVMTGVVEGNAYYIYRRSADDFSIGTNYGGFTMESQNNAFHGTIMLEDNTVGNCEGTEDAHIGARMVQEYGGPVDTTSQTTIADSGYVNITAVGAGTAHTFIGVTTTATATYEEVRIRLEDGASEDDGGDFIKLDGIIPKGVSGDGVDPEGMGDFLLWGGGGSFMDSDVSASDVDADFVYGHLANCDINLVGTGYSHTTKTAAPTVTVAAPPAKTFNAASAVAGTLITIANHGLVKDDAVTYSENGGTAIAELTDGGTFFVVSVDGDDIELSASAGGTAISMTDGASENHTLTGETATATATLGPGGVRGSAAAHTGWNLVTVGTGGRAGRVHYETLVAGSITGDKGGLGDQVELAS
jgi:hypothetical protein